MISKKAILGRFVALRCTGLRIALLTFTLTAMPTIVVAETSVAKSPSLTLAQAKSGASSKGNAKGKSKANAKTSPAKTSKTKSKARTSSRPQATSSSRAGFDSAGNTTAASAGSTFAIGFACAILLLLLVSVYRVFVAAGEPGWAVFVPIFGNYVMTKIAGRPGWWTILLFLPYVSLIFYAIVNVGIAKNFGKGTLFGIGLTFLPFIFYPLLAFGDATYSPDGAATPRPFAPTRGPGSPYRSKNRAA